MITDVEYYLLKLSNEYREEMSKSMKSYYEKEVFEKLKNDILDKYEKKTYLKREAFIELFEQKIKYSFNPNSISYYIIEKRIRNRNIAEIKKANHALLHLKKKKRTTFIENGLYLRPDYLCLEEMKKLVCDGFIDSILFRMPTCDLMSALITNLKFKEAFYIYDLLLNYPKKERFNNPTIDNDNLETMFTNLCSREECDFRFIDINDLFENVDEKMVEKLKGILNSSKITKIEQFLLNQGREVKEEDLIRIKSRMNIIASELEKKQLKKVLNTETKSAITKKKRM